MGTWAIPDTKEKIEKAKKAVETIENLKKDLYNVVGEDILFDKLEDAKYIINHFINECS